jgi:hypothetical protein
MAASEIVVAVEIRFAWWFNGVYVPGLTAVVAACWFMGIQVEPDEDKFSRVMTKAAKFYINGDRVYAG